LQWDELDTLVGYIEHLEEHRGLVVATAAQEESVEAKLEVETE
jgi:hypothetical protein